MTKLAKINLPKLGESVAEATITKWHKQVGDFIKKDEILCEIGTDKVETELPSEFSGIIKELLFQQGAEVKVGQTIAIVETEKTVFSSKVIEKLQNPSKIIPNTGTRERPLIEKESEAGFLSPVVRKMIAEHSISNQEILQLSGSGTNQRITKKDIEAFLQQKASMKLEMPKALHLKIEASDEVIELSKSRQMTAKNFLEASQWIPHVTSFLHINVSALVNHRNSRKDDFFQHHKSKLTFTHYFSYFVVQALKEFPKLNSWLNEQQWILKNQINLGFAVALDDEHLVVPNLKSAGDLNFQDFALKMNEIIKSAKNKKLAASDFEHTTFTVSNTGIFGSEYGTPIIIRPQVAVMAFGAIQRKPVVVKSNGREEIIPADIMVVSLSYDHRVIDGALASKFLTKFKEIAENITELGF